MSTLANDASVTPSNAQSGEDPEVPQEWLLGILELLNPDGEAVLVSSMDGVNQIFVGAEDIPLIVQTHPVTIPAREELKGKILCIGDDDEDVDAPWVDDVRVFVIGKPWDLQPNSTSPEVPTSVVFEDQPVDLVVARNEVAEDPKRGLSCR